MIRNVLAFIFVWAVALSTQGHAQMLRCIEDSPERRGQPGCSVVVEKRLPAPLTQPVMWHIDEFTSLAAAEKAEGAIVAAGETMRMVGIGTGPRRSLVLILHDAEQPASTVVQDPPALQRCQ